MPSDYSKLALLGFLDTVVEKGWVNRNTAAGLKAACIRILGDVPNEQDVRTVDVNTAVIRYSNRNPGVLAPNSLAQYQQRVARAISDFVRFTENPVALAPQLRGVARKNERKMTEKTMPKSSLASRDQSGRAQATPQPITPSQGTGLALSFPLRADFLAQIVIPRDLKADEARRLAAFLMTLSMDYRPAGTNDETPKGDG